MKAVYYPSTQQRRVAVIGGGPVGLMAAGGGSEWGGCLLVRGTACRWTEIFNCG